jgi:hypothetical protein
MSCRVWCVACALFLCRVPVRVYGRVCVCCLLSFQYVWSYLMGMRGSYGTLTQAHNPPSQQTYTGTATVMGAMCARGFADYFNIAGNAAQYGLQRLPLRNPYDAPAGSVVVVGPGTPGTSDTTAGDITVSSDQKMGSEAHGYPGCNNCHYFSPTRALMHVCRLKGCVSDCSFPPVSCRVLCHMVLCCMPAVNDGSTMNYHAPNRFAQDGGNLLGVYAPL